MKIFLIENETDNIMVYTIAKDADGVKGAERFKNEAGLAKLAANWPVQRLVDIWNSLPGVTPIKKFKDRTTAVARIWKVIENMGEVVAEARLKAPAEAVDTSPQEAPQTPDVALQAPTPANVPTRGKKAPTSAAAPAVREGSKTDMVVTLLKRPGGVTAQELMTATGWQAHSVRGFIAGTARKKLALNVVSSKNETGERVYSVEK